MVLLVVRRVDHLVVQRVTVLAEDGTAQRTYLLEVTRESPPTTGNGDASLTSLHLSVGAFDQVARRIDRQMN